MFFVEDKASKTTGFAGLVCYGKSDIIIRVAIDEFASSLAFTDEILKNM